MNYCGHTGSANYPTEFTESVKSVDFSKNLIHNVDKWAPNVTPHVYFQAGEIKVPQDSNVLQTK
jgi:hypothetical protein